MPSRWDQPAKYAPLQRFLETVADEAVTLSFADIEALLGAPLPSTAWYRRSWWANATRTPQARAWLGAGYYMRGVRVQEQMVTFMRVVAN